ncbi:hypothetical protein BN946_scf185033.g4 [Trametes cinnabarina]|uniref:Uncharacterized protein n=1 Tax=Pycnoporus cinnabarinus TaxID=5643 RepID=A0A060SQM3_PYCCI|nr:hypothetical protein BN946_scf185033.g4 [Trametes cinnabarina]
MHTINRPFICGWAVTRDWMRCFWKASEDVSGWPVWSDHQLGLTMTWGRLRLKWCLGALDHVMMMTMGVRPDLPVLDDAVTNMFFDQLPSVDVVGIACTVNRNKYFDQPDEATYEWLKKIFGGEPAWFGYPLSAEAYYAQDG